MHQRLAGTHKGSRKRRVVYLCYIQLAIWQHSSSSNVHPQFHPMSPLYIYATGRGPFLEFFHVQWSSYWKCSSRGRHIQVHTWVEVFFVLLIKSSSISTLSLLRTNVTTAFHQPSCSLRVACARPTHEPSPLQQESLFTKDSGLPILYLPFAHSLPRTLLLQRCQLLLSWNH